LLRESLARGLTRAVAVAVGCSGCIEQVPPQPVPATFDAVLVLGDSVALGTGASTSLGTQVNTNYGPTYFANRAVGGHECADVLAGLGADLDAISGWDTSGGLVVFVIVGGNDARTVISSGGTPSDLSAVLAGVRSCLAQIVETVRAEHPGALLYVADVFDPTDGGLAPHPSLGDLSAYVPAIESHTASLLLQSKRGGWSVIRMRELFDGHGLSGQSALWYATPQYVHPNTGGQFNLYYYVRDSLLGAP
jgi:hypothetical protein